MNCGPLVSDALRPQRDSAHLSQQHLAVDGQRHVEKQIGRQVKELGASRDAIFQRSGFGREVQLLLLLGLEVRLAKKQYLLGIMAVELIPIEGRRV